MREARSKAGGMTKVHPFFAGCIALSLLAGCVGSAPPPEYPRGPAPPAFPFVFAVAGNAAPSDGGGAADAVWKAMASDRPAFVLVPGNAIGTGAPEAAWEAFDGRAAPLVESGAAVFPAPGPLDLAAGDTDRLRSWGARFPWAAKRSWYSVRVRNVLIVALDTNGEALGRARKAQEDWLERELASASREAGVNFVFVLLPRGPVSNGPARPRDVSLERLAALLASCPKARVVFSGVEGAYQRIRHADRWWITTGGGGGPRTEVFPEPERRRFLDAFEGGRIRPFHYVRVRVEETRFTLEMLALDERTGAFAPADRLEEGKAVPLQAESGGEGR